MRPDARLAKRVNEVVAEVAQGQKPDGYLYANPLPRKWRWANLETGHEFYDLGHLIEAAVALHQATGRRMLLDVVCRAADLVEKNFGWEKGKRRGYDGHEEIELALVRLYHETREPRYLKLAKFFVDVRGTRPNYFEQEGRKAAKLGIPHGGWFARNNLEGCQAHRPVREQTDAVGHAVRAMYLYSGIADVAAETGDRELLATCKRLWQSAVRRRMYIHGGVGSTPHGEAFTYDYDLPNEMAYAETCASIALVFFAHRMLQIEADGEYADVMERALYNNIPAGVSGDGRRFFYSNRLTVYPKVLQKEQGERGPVRREWFGWGVLPAERRPADRLPRPVYLLDDRKGPVRAPLRRRVRGLHDRADESSGGTGNGISVERQDPPDGEPGVPGGVWPGPPYSRLGTNV